MAEQGAYQRAHDLLAGELDSHAGAGAGDHDGAEGWTYRARLLHGLASLFEFRSDRRGGSLNYNQYICKP